MSSAVGRLRLFSMLEAISFLVLLCIAMPVKYAGDKPILVQVVGPIHGVFFIMYVLGALDVRKRLSWDVATTLKVLVAAVIPVAPFFVEKWLRAQEPVGARA